MGTYKKTKFAVDNSTYICYIAHMNTMLLDSYTADKVTEYLPSADALDALKVFFDALSDVTRLKILSALSVSPMCVTDLAALTGINQTTVSHNLRILKSARVVSVTRQGKVAFYSLTGRNVENVLNVAVGAVFDAKE